MLKTNVEGLLTTMFSDNWALSRGGPSGVAMKVAASKYWKKKRPLLYTNHYSFQGVPAVRFQVRKFEFCGEMFCWKFFVLQMIFHLKLFYSSVRKLVEETNKDTTT